MNLTLPNWLFLIGVLATLGAPAAAERFVSAELFRIPFGQTPDTLGSRVENGQFSFPRDFVMDGAGRFYIYDTHKHRVVRFSSAGKFEIGFRYPATAGQIFAHPDARENLWLLMSDPGRGLYYGVYSSEGKPLREGVFAQFNQFRLHLDDDSALHVILSSSKRPGSEQIFWFDEASLLMKKENIPRPPENHHEIRREEQRFFIDAVPGSAQPTHRITDQSRRRIAEIRGDVIYMTEQGDIYTQLGDCDIHVYELNGRLKGKVSLTGLPSACKAVRFDSTGAIYQLDAIPDAEGRYTPATPGMRLIRWTLK